MNADAHRSVSTKQKEMLVTMTALVFVEQNALLTKSQLSDAKKSLQALFLRTSGEETMLRKLIEILRVNKDLHQAFSVISKISTSVSTSVDIITKKISYLRQYVGRLNLTPEESNDFFTPFLSYSHSFLQKVGAFGKEMGSYLDVKEHEARRAHEFRIAQEASARLRARLSGTLGGETQGEVEKSIKQEVMQTFDFAEAQRNLQEAQRESRIAANEINALLLDLKAMCQMAMNPEMREKNGKASLNGPAYEDVFTLFTRALKGHPRLDKIKDFIVDYFKLYQRAYGMFILDLNNIHKAVDTIANNPEQYFDAKQEDEDIKVKTEKLKKIEGLIPFLEATALVLSEAQINTYQKFSKQLSDLISRVRVDWEHISEDLLVAKVSAEAELSTVL